MHPKFLLTVVVILLTTPLWSSVGNVDIHEGNGEIERDTGDKFVTALDLEIFMSDTVKTGNGKTSLLFVDVSETFSGTCTFDSKRKKE